MTPCALVREQAGKSAAGVETERPGKKIDLSTLLITNGPPGFSLYANHSMDYAVTLQGHGSVARQWDGYLRNHHFERGWRRIYLQGQKNLLTEVLEFATRTDAVAFQRASNTLTCSVSTDAFVVPDVPGSIGLRYAFSDGRRVEQVSFVSGRRRFLVLMGGYASLPSRDALMSFTRTEATQAQHASVTVCDQVETLLPAHANLGTTDMPLADALPESAPAGLAITNDESAPTARMAETLGGLESSDLQDHGFLGGRFRAWRSPSHFLSAFVVQFQSTQDAVAIQEKHALTMCSGADGWFGLDKVEGAVGIQYHYPFGPREVVTFARGARLFMVHSSSSSVPFIDILNEFVEEFADQVTRS